MSMGLERGGVMKISFSDPLETDVVVFGIFAEPKDRLAGDMASR